jgi:hypothetical protein
MEYRYHVGFFDTSGPAAGAVVLIVLLPFVR